MLSDVFERFAYMFDIAPMGLHPVLGGLDGGALGEVAR